MVVLPEPDRDDATMRPRAVMTGRFDGDGNDWAHYRQHNEPARPSAPPGLDNRHLRHRGCEGRLHCTVDWRIPRSGRGDAPARRAPVLRARGHPKGRGLRHRRRRQGCRRRSGCYPRCAGAGVGIVTRAGLPVPPGEPAINPAPRRMICDAIEEVAASHPLPSKRGRGRDVEVEIGVADGERLAAKTLNARLGIVGGLSILGTTGIVVPYSCAAWIHSIHQGIDVAHAAGLSHIAGSTGSNSESAVQKFHGLPEIALIDMGDFVGGMLKYLRRHPIARVTIAGGVGKMTKLAQGRLDLHSKRGSVDLAALADLAKAAGASEALAQHITVSKTAAEAFGYAAAENVALGHQVARTAQRYAMKVVADSGIVVEIVLFDRGGRLVGHAPFGSHHGWSPPRNRR